MPTESNLIKNSDRTPEERRELARRAGIASGEARNRKKKGKELVQALLERGVQDQGVLRMMEDLGFDSDEISNELAMHIRQIEKAQKKADTRAYIAVMKVAGYDESQVNVKLPPMVVTPEERDALNRWAAQEDGDASI